MLELRNIIKNYYVGTQTVEALKGIDLKFRRNEFVSILGPSGCGKTTLLNIIGGLDRYTSGDLLIDQKSTKGYKDKDWDAYRNSIIGFVFQNYNLISHLSVLDNVEMALSLSGVSAKERKARATKVLDDVGLKDQLYKRPNQLSGGQQQRVAIARALVNNPKVLLADEPTGALDSKTNRQIMQLIQEISKDRLVIMVTHNEKIATKYSDRLIKLLDGEVLSDTNGVKEDKLPVIDKLDNKRTSMSFWLAMKTSFKNLFTKRARTLITALAGSIGIVGVALVLGISTGMTDYVGELETDTLAGFPITIDQAVYTDQFGPPEGTPLGGSATDTFPDEEVVYAYDSAAASVTHVNVISEDFVTYLNNMDESLYNSISYTSAITMNVVTETATGGYELVALEGGFGFFGQDSVFNEVPSNDAFVLSQYDVIAGNYASNYDEVVLVVDNKNQLDVDKVESLGFSLDSEYAFDDFLGETFEVIPNNTFYNETMGIYLPSSDYESMYLSEESVTVEIVGIVRVTEDATSEVLSTGIGYLPGLTDYMHDLAVESDIVQAQMANPDTNVLTGQAFNDTLTYETVMQKLGGDSTPTSVQIYTASYESKDEVKAYIDAYNVDKTDDEAIVYSDLAATIGTTISSLINTITIVLTAFAGISLVVSSIMIGIITYVSVIERTKEIGIMRSLGARKKDISRIFNAETLLIGLTSGILGVGLYYILQGPLNIIIGNLIDVSGFANLPIYYALSLIALSSILTILAGLIPARIAAKKDPVIALRTE